MEIDDLRAIASPLARAKRAGELIEEHRDAMAAYKAVRVQSIKEAAQNMRQTEIARGLGIDVAIVNRAITGRPKSKGRPQQSSSESQSTVNPDQAGFEHLNDPHASTTGLLRGPRRV